MVCSSDIALPCAAEEELDLEAVKNLSGNGCIAIAEGAIRLLTREARRCSTIKKEKHRLMPMLTLHNVLYRQ